MKRMRMMMNTITITITITMMTNTMNTIVMIIMRTIMTVETTAEIIMIVMMIMIITTMRKMNGKKIGIKKRRTKLKSMVTKRTGHNTNQEIMEITVITPITEITTLERQAKTKLPTMKQATLMILTWLKTGKPPVALAPTPQVAALLAETKSHPTFLTGKQSNRNSQRTRLQRLGLRMMQPRKKRSKKLNMGMKRKKEKLKNGMRTGPKK